jgi:tRNA G18 (ribose-2'-O)-methylase SpoU
MGHALAVPFARIGSVAEAAGALESAGFEVSALALADRAEPMHAFEPGSDRMAWVLGAEGPGLSGAAMRAASRIVRIDMQPGVDSLNVVTAAAIALHGTRRPPARP